MIAQNTKKGFTLIEVVVSLAVFLLFAVGINSALQLVFRLVYASRVTILETSILTEQLETVRNLPYQSVGILNGVPAGALPHSTTTIRNGLSFTVTTAVRNIDDPYDGTIGGTPNDTAPADYKLVEIWVKCNTCSGSSSKFLSTIVPPKSLEGSTQNGALFINVFDASGRPVQGASVHVVSQNPYVTIDDVTDNDGFLRIIDTPTGTQSYNISITKPGYSSDYTVIPNESNPSPSKLPWTVISQTVSDAPFQIDLLSSLKVKTMTLLCSARDRSFDLIGSKMIGLGVPKYWRSFTTAGGEQQIDDLEWDNYRVSVSSTGYDLAGSIPLLPMMINPGTAQNLTLLLTPHTDNSLLVKVVDAGSGLPVSNADVTISKIDDKESMITGVGYIRQTDWSGRLGVSTVNQYSDGNGVDVVSSPGDIKLSSFGGNYISTGYLESATFDTDGMDNLLNVKILPFEQVPETGDNPVRVQLAFSDTSTPASWNFVGPDGTSDSYYTPTSTTIYNDGGSHQFMRYRIYLTTADPNVTPVFSELSITYTNGCSAPGQAFFSNLDPGTYDIFIEKNGYISTTFSFDVNGSADTVINLSPSS